MSWLPLLPVLPLLLGATLATIVGSGRSARTSVAASIGALAGSLTVAVVTGLSLTSAIAVFVSGLVVVVCTFSRRHLDGDPARRRYDSRLMATSAAALLALSGQDLLVIAIGWVLTGIGLTALVGHHVETPGTFPAVRALRRSRLAADLGLVVAVGALVASSGSSSVAQVNAWAEQNAGSPSLIIAGLALLLATAARAGLIPFSRWVPLSVIAPAPVSALLHAGVVNLPVILLLQLAPVWQGNDVVPVALGGLALATAVLTFPRLLVRADVKTRLAWSTTAQLGFMLTLLAVGAHAAAVLHLVLHSVYKAGAFLWAGDQLSRLRRDPAPAAGRVSMLAGAGLGLVAATGLLIADGAARHPLSAAAVLVAGTAGGYGLASLRARPMARVVAAMIAVAAVGAVLAAVHLVSAGLDLPLHAAGVGAWMAAAMLLAMAVTGVVLRARRPVRAWSLLHRWADPTAPWWMVRLAALRAGRSAQSAQSAQSARSARSARSCAPVPCAASGVAVTSDPGRAHDLRDQIARAGAELPPSWGWQSFIASNPLAGLVQHDFDDAVRRVAARGWSPLPGLSLGLDPRRAETPGGRSAQWPEHLTDRVLTSWLAAWTALADAPWSAPGSKLRLWHWLRTVGSTDPAFPRSARRALRALPASPLNYLTDQTTGLSPDEVREWADRALLRTPGWAGYLGRRRTTAAALDVDALVDLLAVRTAVGQLLGAPAPGAPAPGAPALGACVGAADVARDDAARDDAAQIGELQLGLQRLAQIEATTRAPLLAALSTTSPIDDRTPADQPGEAARAAADLVFCIDVRSEPLRRHLERAGTYRTLGFAGFFAMPVRRESGARAGDRLPAPLAPAAVVSEQPRTLATIAELLLAGLRQALDSPGAGFAAVDVAAVKGTLAGLRVLAPSWAGVPQRHSGQLQVDDEHRAALHAAAAALVGALGLSGPRTARLVVLTGHGSTSTNNPAEAAFDCGACGGNRGALNARLAAQLLNDPAVRAALAEQGHLVPADTVFVAAEHDTALDQVVWLDQQAVPASHQQELAQLRADLSRAGAQVSVERCRLLPLERASATTASPSAVDATSAVDAVRRRALDPSQVRHEWGLAGNAFFIAAPRAVTAKLDLAGRAFLHEYEAAADPDHTLLETILTAPLVVAQWINAQYFFSGADPHRLGSGSKTSHNPVGGVGVLSGAGGDLRVGLTEQSVRHDGAPVHEPVRLWAVVAAEPGPVDAVLARHDGVHDLVRGGWLTLSVLSPSTGALLHRTGSGWQADPAWLPAQQPQRSTDELVTAGTQLTSNPGTTGGRS